MLLSRNSQGSSKEYYAMLKEAGWQAIDINETCNPAKFLVSQEEQDKFLESVIKNIEEAGLVVGQCHAPMAEWYAGKTDEEIETKILSIVNCVRTVGKYNVPCTIVHPFIYSWSENDPDPERTFNLNVEYLKRVCEVCGNTLVCLENMPGYRGAVISGEDMKKMGEAVGDKLYFCLDTGHASSNNLNTSSFFEAVGDRIKALHVHDSMAGMDKHLLPYLGGGDWQDFKNAIKKYNYTGTLNSEANYAIKLPNEKRLTWEKHEREVFETLL